MSSFHKQAQIDAENILQEFSVGTGRYAVAADGSEKTVMVAEEPLQDLAFQEYGQARLKFLLIKSSDITRPAVHDTIEIGDEVWTVRENVSKNRYIHRLLCEFDRRGGR